MAAILGLDIPALEKVCAEASIAGEIVQVANDNCPGQVVISGAKTAVERAIEGAKGRGRETRHPAGGQYCGALALDGFHPGRVEPAVDGCQMTIQQFPVSATSMQNR